MGIETLMEQAHTLLTEREEDEGRDPAAGEAALDLLLSAWQQTREPRVAAIIEQVGRSAVDTRSRPPIRNRDSLDEAIEWERIAKQRDPADVDRLLEKPWRGTWHWGNEALASLVQFRPDPRIAMALARTIATPPYETLTSVTFWRGVFAHLEALRDPRTLPLLEAEVGRTKPERWERAMRSLESQTALRLRELVIEHAYALSKAEERALAKLEAPFSRKKKKEQDLAVTIEGLLAEVYASPDDDAPREVCADWYSERGDPRGEMITLQLARHRDPSRAMSRREHALISKHGKAWAGPLDPWLENKPREHERGFLARGVFHLDRRLDSGNVATMLHPAWATMRDLDLTAVTSPDVCFAMLRLPQLRHLRVVRGIDAETVARLARASREEGALPIEELDVHLSASARDDVVAAQRAIVDGVFPKLRALTLSGVDDPTRQLAWLDTLPRKRRLARVSIRTTVDGAPFGDLVRALSSRYDMTPSIIEAILPYSSRCTISVSALADPKRSGRHTRLRIQAALASGPSFFEYILQYLPRDQVTWLEISCEEAKYDITEELDAFQRSLRRFPNLKEVLTPWPSVNVPLRRK